MMGEVPNPNLNPKCGSIIQILDPSTRKTHSATVVETCVFCGNEDIDASPGLFTKIATLSEGRVPVAWGGDEVGG